MPYSLPATSQQHRARVEEMLSWLSDAQIKTIYRGSQLGPTFLPHSTGRSYVVFLLHKLAENEVRLDYRYARHDIHKVLSDVAYKMRLHSTPIEASA